jgi:hypothetical protein
MRMENEARANGTVFVQPQSVFTPASPPVTLPAAPYVQNAQPFYTMPDQRREYSYGKPAPKGCLRDIEGNIFLANTVQACDVGPGVSQYASSSSRKVVAQTSLGVRVVATTVNCDELAEWYRDQVMLYVAGAVETIEAYPPQGTE